MTTLHLIINIIFGIGMMILLVILPTFVENIIFLFAKLDPYYTKSLITQARLIIIVIIIILSMLYYF